MKQASAILLLLLSLLGTGCSSDEASPIISQGSLTIANVANQWTYVSLTQGRVVGTCSISDTTAQRQWSQRNDWDMAVCNGMIRTNGGDSGNGQGGIAVSPSTYEQTDAAWPVGYTQDRDTVPVW
ncbi:MAG: hypothetical protein IJ588_08325 [Prevotella sp.]|nr:hypothetical protein [Prevotella sp.]